MRIIQKTFCTLFILAAAAGMVFPEKVAELEEVMQPSMLAADGEHLFVLDGIRVHVYAMKDWKHLRSFGKNGDGPGEFTSNFVNRLSMIMENGDLFMANMTKMARFTPRGELKMEKIFPFMVMQVVPLGDHYVITRFIPGEGGINSQSVRIYNKDLEETANLYSRPDISMQRSRKLDCPNEQIFVRVHNGRVYVQDQRPGTHVMVFDRNGAKITEFSLPVERIPMPQSYKDEVVEWARTAVTQIADFQNRSGLTLEQMLQMIDFHEILPGARNFLVRENGDMLIETYEKKAGRARFITFDTRGRIKSECFLTDPEPGQTKMMPYATYTVYGNRFFYLKDNPDSETWELHIESLAPAKK